VAAAAAIDGRRRRCGGRCAVENIDARHPRPRRRRPPDSRGGRWRGSALRRLAVAAVAAVGGDAAAFAVAVTVTVAAVRAATPPSPPSARLVFLLPHARAGSLIRHPCRRRLDDPG